MLLTGKCKEDFELWLFERNTPIEEYKNFHVLSETCKNAIRIEWFDSIGIYINIRNQDLQRNNGYNKRYYIRDIVR